MRYINSTLHIGLCYKKGHSVFDMVEYVDLDFACDKDSMKSTIAFYFTLGGYCISWKSQLQPLVAWSSTEAKHIALTKAFKKGIWLQGILKEIGILHGNIIIYSDSQSAIYLCKKSYITWQN